MLQQVQSHVHSDYKATRHCFCQTCLIKYPANWFSLTQTHDALQQYGDFLPHDLSALAEAFHYDIDLNEVMVSRCFLLTSQQTCADPALLHTLSIQRCAGKAAAY